MEYSIIFEHSTVQTFLVAKLTKIEITLKSRVHTRTAYHMKTGEHPSVQFGTPNLDLSTQLKGSIMPSNNIFNFVKLLIPVKYLQIFLL